MEEEEKVVVVKLIETATHSTEPMIDQRLLKSIKSVVRSSDSELRFAARTLISLMKRDHSQVRYLALLVIDELFMRSKLFRTIIVDNLDLLLSLSVGFRRSHPLPDPAAVATVLRSKAIEFLEKWNDSFGVQYRLLRLGYEYLKNTLRYQFPNLQANAARVREERIKREKKTKEILLKKFNSLKKKFPSIKKEIHQSIIEINEGLDIVRTEEELEFDLDDEEMEEFRNSELRQIRLDSLKEAEKVHENSENKVVFDALREIYKVLVTKHLPAIQEWISLLIRVEVEDTRFRDNTLKDLIDMKARIYLTKKKCEDLGCDFSKNVNAEEEDIWEEGTIESFDERKFSKNNDQPSTSSAIDASSSKKVNLSKGKEKVSGHSNRSELDPLRSKLLTEAPVINWGSYLDNWGSNRDALANQRGLDLESHWGRVDQDAVIPSQRIAELNVHASVYKEDSVEIQPCRAPLRSGGGLCQRRDLKTCPFHGPIVKRDDEGKPLIDCSLPDEPEESTSGVKNGIIDGLFKQAVRNVRERDTEEVRKKVLDQKALKRAKLAKVREHNDAVLRDAALAATWRSEAVEPENASSSSTRGKKKKQTLASMLKKKETTKHRLSQKLVSGRGRGGGATKLSVAEDSKYREAFPNQW